MSLDNRPHYSGGCQCGAVRFCVDGALGDASVCHCRMCQKAAGNFYLPLVSVGDARLTGRGGEPKRFRSSSAALRGFCAECGTPLTYEAPDGVALAIGAFDMPEDIAPTVAWGVEAKLPYVDDIAHLPEKDTMGDLASAPFLAELKSFQHPDYDTESWPPEAQNEVNHIGQAAASAGRCSFRIHGQLGRASICHCRMCQKAFGGFFGPACVGAPKEGVEWTREEPSYFQSSVNIDRGFCAALRHAADLPPSGRPRDRHRRVRRPLGPDAAASRSTPARPFPPSVLSDISPSRGEISRPRTAFANHQRCRTSAVDDARDLPP
jgi:hypothetical protein